MNAWTRRLYLVASTTWQLQAELEPLVATDEAGNSQPDRAQ